MLTLVQRCLRKQMALTLTVQRMRMLVVRGINSGRAMWRFSDSCQGLFQISVKLPHEPHKIQVMVGI